MLSIFFYFIFNTKLLKTLKLNTLSNFIVILYQVSNNLLNRFFETGFCFTIVIIVAVVYCASVRLGQLNKYT